MQPQSDLAIVTRSSNGDRPSPASSPPRRALPVPLNPTAVLTDLSGSICQIRGLQQRHTSDDELQSQLRRTEAELETLIDRLLHTDGSGPSPPPARRTSTNTLHPRDAEQAFLAWLAEPTVANELLLAGGETPVPVTQVLGELSLSRQTLPTETTASFGLPDGTTIGHVAAELLIAVNDPAGPRCWSYRSAVYYLRELDRDAPFEPDDSPVPR